MSYLIDSDVVVDVLFARIDAVSLVARLRRSGIAVSAIPYMDKPRHQVVGSGEQD